MEGNNHIILKQIDSILEDISRAVNAERSSFFILNKDENKLEALVAQGLEDHIIKVAVGQGITGHVAQTGEAKIINDAQNDPLLDKTHDLRSGFVTNQVLCVPVFNEHREVLGVIQAINRKKGQFGETDLITLDSLANTIALVIKNVHLYDLANRGREAISTLLEVSSAISSELDLDKLIQLIMDKASEITDSDRGTLFLLDAANNELWSKYGKGLDDRRIRIPLNKGIVGMVAGSKEPYIVNDAYNNPFFDQTFDKKTGYKTDSILSVPVLNADKELQGVIQVINKKTGKFTIQDLQILNGFASQTSVALENAKLFDEINRMKNHLDDMIQNMHSGIITVDQYGMIKTVNKSLCEMLEIQAEDFIGKNYEQLRKQFYPIFYSNKEVIKTGKRYEEYDVTAPLDNNKRVIYNLNAIPMQDTKGRSVGALSVLDDVTQEKRIKENLSRYLPKHLIKEVINKDGLSLLNGRAQTSSILFSDIRSFTTLTEQLGAIEIVAMLNDYFHSMVDAIYNYNGILDKFIGDAIMAVFGVPYPEENDAVNAVNSALSMFTRLHMLNAQRAKSSKMPLKIGIGISTGQVVSGNIGSEKRLEYTVIGDAVNLASRLEGATKKYGVSILICKSTYEQIKDQFYCREIDCITVSGKKQPTEIFSVMGTMHNPPSSHELEFLDTYLMALNFYRNRKFDRALAAFQYANLLKAE
ncbi:MAG: adenylate/guanylate cyclase domain-containing protein, partial [Bacteroidota bacterium]